MCGDLFIQVHWGSWGQESMLDGTLSPPFQGRPRPGVRRTHNQPTVWLMIPARGAIDNHGALHTKAVSLVTLAPVWEHLAVKEVKLWIYVCRTCLPQTLHCLGVKDKSPSKSLSPFYVGWGGSTLTACDWTQFNVTHRPSSSRFISTLLLMYHCFLCPLCLKLIIVYHN